MPSADEVADAVLKRLQAPGDQYPAGTASHLQVWSATLDAARRIETALNVDKLAAGIASKLPGVAKADIEAAVKDALREGVG